MTTVAAAVKLVNVVSKKDGRTGVAAVGDTRVVIDFHGSHESTEVAASTFKRWYTVTGEAAPVQVIEEEVKEEVKEDKQETSSDKGVHIALRDYSKTGTRGGKCDKITMSIELDSLSLDIVEYDGFITSVKVLDSNGDVENGSGGWQVIYTSPKDSLKDTLEHLGYDAENQKLIKQHILAIRRAVKLEILAKV